MVARTAERFDPEGSKGPEGKWGPGTVIMALVVGADNGSGARNSPGFGFENRTERRSFRSNGSASGTGVEAKAQVGSIDLGMARERRYGRAKGRAEFPAPVEL